MTDYSDQIITIYAKLDSVLKLRLREEAIDPDVLALIQAVASLTEVVNALHAELQSQQTEDYSDSWLTYQHIKGHLTDI